MSGTGSREAWFLVVDSEHARLLRAVPAEHGHVHVDEAASLTGSFGRDHARPAMVGQPGRHATTGHVREEKLAHFAREAAPWLERELAARKVQRCALFAPAHVLGALRGHVSATAAAALLDQPVELAQLSLAELARHPRVREWFAAVAGAD